MRRTDGTSPFLRDLRSLQVVVFHPNDQDGQEITRQLQRIGCQVKAFWPPQERLTPEADLVILAVRPEVLSIDLPWIDSEERPPVIAVVTYENPTIVEAVLRLRCNGTLASPVRSFGLLTSIVVARQFATELREKSKLARRLEHRLAGIRRLTKAKAILVQTRGITEEQAYEIIREQAMSKRTTTEEIANAIINANDILAYQPKSESLPKLTAIPGRRG